MPMPKETAAQCQFRVTDPSKDNGMVRAPDGFVIIKDIAAINPKDKRPICLLAVLEGAKHEGKLEEHCIYPDSAEADCPLAQGVCETRKATVFQFHPKEPTPTYSI